MAVKVIVGLGNPGDEYKNTRHNLGFDLLNRIAEDFSFNWKFDKKFNAEIAEGIIDNQKVSLIKPQTFMNLSGYSVEKFKEYYKLTNDAFLVAYDDYNLNLEVNILPRPRNHPFARCLKRSICKTVLPCSFFRFVLDAL